MPSPEAPPRARSVDFFHSLQGTCDSCDTFNTLWPCTQPYAHARIIPARPPPLACLCGTQVHWVVAAANRQKPRQPGLPLVLPLIPTTAPCPATNARRAPSHTKCWYTHAAPSNTMHALGPQYFECHYPLVPALRHPDPRLPPPAAPGLFSRPAPMVPPQPPPARHQSRSCNCKPCMLHRAALTHGPQIATTCAGCRVGPAGRRRCPRLRPPPPPPQPAAPPAAAEPRCASLAPPPAAQRSWAQAQAVKHVHQGRGHIHTA